MVGSVSASLYRQVQRGKPYEKTSQKEEVDSWIEENGFVESKREREREPFKEREKKREKENRREREEREREKE